jgi:hypothetical protein
MENFQKPELYGELTVKTTDAWLKLGLKTEKYFTGIQPILSYIWYGGYEAYDKGVSDESRRYWGNSAGSIFFFRYNWVQFFSTIFEYRPDYKFYSKGFFDTQIDLPDNHFQQAASCDLLFDSVEKKNLNRIKHGVLLKVRYEFAHRSGYGTFKDTPEVEDSDIKNTRKIYSDAGFYYTMMNDINLQIDIKGGIHHNVDRNNAEKIGYMLADHAVVPGYNAAEFYHNRYLVSGIRLGLPIPFWLSRIQPGFHVLYMPRNNSVVGVGDYDRSIYRSISCGLSFMAGNILPVFIDYGYGIDAERKGERGNHEVQVIFLMAFGKN